jgi:hypothetical protein
MFIWFVLIGRLNRVSQRSGSIGIEAFIFIHIQLLLFMSIDIELEHLHEIRAVLPVRY